MDICKIGNKEYDVIVASIQQSFEKLYAEDTGRTIGQGCRMNLNCLGTFLTYTVEIYRRDGHEADFDELFELVSLPSNDGIPVTMVNDQTSISYDAYISSGSRAVKRVDKERGIVYWDKMQLKIVPMEAWKTV